MYQKHLAILFSLSMAALVSCAQNQDQFIVQTSFEQFQPTAGEAVTQKDLQALSLAYREVLLANTIGKKIPPTTIWTPDGDSLMLDEIIKSPTVLFATDVYCGFGMEAAEKDIPGAVDLLAKEGIHLNHIFMLRREAVDLVEPQRFQKQLERLKLIYGQIYVIDAIEAGKLNLNSSPVRMCVGGDLIVTCYNGGLSTIERLADELRQLVF